MAERAARTEPATPARREEARRRGHVAVSPALAPAAVLATGLGVATVGAPLVVQHLRTVLVDWLAAAGPLAIADGDLRPLAWRTAIPLAGLLGPFLVALALAGVGVTVAQVGLRPRGLRLDPARLAAGWRRLASIDGLARLVKVLVELAIVLAVGWWTMRAMGTEALAASALPIGELVALAGHGVGTLGAALATVLVAIAAADYAWARRRHEQRLATSREELREETRRREGDPRLRARLRRAHRAIVRQSGTGEVAGADVVLVSPDDVAVALRYRAAEGAAPRLVAVALGRRTARMIDGARAGGVPIVRRRELARAIWRAVPIGGEIPPACYAAVAEILAQLAPAVATGEAG
jgi:flagellar biosynthetic protein FlhB